MRQQRFWAPKTEAIPDTKGNAIVPEVAEQIMRAIKEVEANAGD